MMAKFCTARFAAKANTKFESLLQALAYLFATNVWIFAMILSERKSRNPMKVMSQAGFQFLRLLKILLMIM